MSSTTWGGLQSYFEAPDSHGNNSFFELKQGQYVHPLCRRSPSTMSLELCTENLGCETGTLDFSSSSSDDDEYDAHQDTKRSGSLSPVTSSPLLSRRTPARAKEMRGNYPPPLTSIRGQHRIAVQARREDGRLLLRAVSAPPFHTYLHAERSNGRLTIRLLGSGPSPLNSEQDEEDFHDDGEEEDEVVDESNEDDLLKDEHEETFLKVENGQNLAGNEINGGGEMGVVEKFQRPSRCKEGGHENKGLMSWGTFCVASS